MLCVPLMGFVNESEAAHSVTGGSGTSDDPYYGDIYVTPVYNDKTTYYVMRGSMMHVTCSEKLACKLIVSDRPYPTIEFYIGKNVTTTFEVDFAYDTFFFEVSGDSDKYGYYCIVDPVPELSFISDPMTDGTISYGNSVELIVNEDAHENQSQEGSE